MNIYTRVGKLSQPDMFFHVKFQRVNNYITRVLFVGQPFAYCVLASAATILTFYDQRIGYIIASSTVEYNDDFEYEYEHENIVEIDDMMELWLENMKPNGIQEIRMMNIEEFQIFCLTNEMFDNVVKRPTILDALIASIPTSSLPRDIALEIYRHVQNNKRKDIKICINDAFLSGFPFSVQVLITNKGWFTYQIIDDVRMPNDGVLCSRCFWWKVSNTLSEFGYGLEHSSTQ